MFVKLLGFLVVTVMTFFEGTAPENIALNKPAFFSSTYPGAAAADAAVDGAYGSCNFYSLETTSTAQADYSPWFAVDLLGQYEIHNVTVFNRAESFPERLYGLIIDAFDDNFDRCSGAVPSHCANITDPVATSETVTCAASTTGRYIRIWKHTAAHYDDLLHLCEVQIYGYKTGNGCGHHTFPRVTGKRLESTGTTTVSAQDAMSCLQSCVMSGSCVAINYNGGTKTCDLISTPEETDTITSSADWVYYGHDFC